MAKATDPLTIARRAKAMTVEQFAAAVKVKPSTIVDWSKGRTRPQPRNLKRLASVLRIPIREVSAMF